MGDEGMLCMTTQVDATQGGRGAWNGRRLCVGERDSIMDGGSGWEIETPLWSLHLWVTQAEGHMFNEAGVLCSIGHCS